MEVCCVIGVSSFVVGASRVVVESPTVEFDVVMPSLCVDDGVVSSDTVCVVCLSGDVVCVTDDVGFVSDDVVTDDSPCVPFDVVCLTCDDICVTVDSLCATGDIVCVTSDFVTATGDVACVYGIVLSVDSIGISSNVTLDVACDCLDVDICVNVVLVNLDVVVSGMSDGTVLVVKFSDDVDVIAGNVTVDCDGVVAVCE